MPAFCSSAADDPASAQSFHFDAKTMGSLSASGVRLKGSFSRHIELIIIYLRSACQPVSIRRQKTPSGPLTFPLLGTACRE